MTILFGWVKCDDCEVRWDSEHAGTKCWMCGKPGERCYRPNMNAPATWFADINDPLPNEDAA